ncbi:hypothetical protein ASE98_22450 [Pseudomonas sp. Leaf48]|nr:hypothetical protein ASE98_22450 [Pseudomonas sp. Leaf48]
MDLALVTHMLRQWLVLMLNDCKFNVSRNLRNQVIFSIKTLMAWLRKQRGGSQLIQSIVLILAEQKFIRSLHEPARS